MGLGAWETWSAGKDGIRHSQNLQVGDFPSPEAGSVTTTPTTTSRYDCVQPVVIVCK